MSGNETHTQCWLERDNVKQVSWLPTEKAEIGKIVDLREEDKNGRKYWDCGWKVTMIGNMTFPSKYIAERERDYKLTRIASDV